MYRLVNHGMGKCFICQGSVCTGGGQNTVATLTTWKGERLEVTVPLCGECLDGIVKMALRGKVE